MFRRNLLRVLLLMSVVSILVPQSDGFELSLPFFRDGDFTGESNEGNLSHDEGMVILSKKHLIHIILLQVSIFE